MTPAQVFERLLELEGLAAASLDVVTREAFTVVKASDADRVASLEALAQNFASDVVQFKIAVRAEALAYASIALGTVLSPVRTDDSEKAGKAAAYYLNTWADALSKEGDWDDVVERAREKAVDALGNVASYEVFDAWNDEQARIVEALKDGTQGRWNTRHDKVVCPECQKLDRKVSGPDGRFDLPGGKRGKPPLHPSCRCFVTLAKKESEEMSQPHKGSVELVTRGCEISTKSINTTDRSVDFVASTDAIDAHGEVVSQDWRLEDFLANPVVLYAHDNRELPIGRATNVGVRNGRLEATIKFASVEANPRAEEVWRLIQEGMLRAVSVGFVPTDGKYEMRDGAEVFVWRAPILKEISVVPVPANQEALARMKAAFAERHSDEKQDAPYALKSERENPFTRLPNNWDIHNDGTVTRRWRTPDGTVLIEEKEKPLPAPPANTNSGDNAEEETDMNDVNKQLQDKVDAQAKEIGRLEGENKSLASARDGETNRAASLESQIKTLETEKAALDAQNKTLASERDAANAKVLEFEAKAITAEVDALVGDKITPAEKDLFLELRKTSPDLFTKMVAQRQPLGLTKQVVPPAPNGAGSGEQSTSGLLAKVRKNAGL